MRIVMVSNNYTPYSGGVVSSLNALIPALRTAGHEVTLITLAFSENHADDPDWVIRVPSCMRFHHKKNPMAVPWRAARFLSETLDALAPDIVHTHHPFLLGAAVARIAKKRAIPVVFTHHTLYDEYAHYVPLPRLVTVPVINALVRRYCSQVNGVIAPSSTVADRVRAAVAPGARVTTIPSGILTLFFQPGYAKNKKGSDGKRSFRLLTAGRFTPEKNVIELLHLVSELRAHSTSRFECTFVGYGCLFDELRQHAYGQLGLSPESVRFIHKPEKAVLAHEYAKADLFLFSSKTDTQGLVLAEAMASGTPVLAFDGPGQRDIVRSGENGFICADRSAMREKILELADNPEVHQKLCAQAYQAALLYHPDRQRERLERFYGHVLRSR